MKTEGAALVYLLRVCCGFARRVSIAFSRQDLTRNDLTTKWANHNFLMLAPLLLGSYALILGLLCLQINAVMRKGAEDTQMLLNNMGQALHDAFLAGVEMHKKYAPKPTGPVEVTPDIKDK
jgi:hypothetical protein